jgi:hypothetical protein
MVGAAALAFLVVTFAFTNAAAWVENFTTVNRATLHAAPLLVCLCVLLWHELAKRAEAHAPAAEPAALGVADA